MYGTYRRLNITVHDGWRAVVRSAARKLTRRALRDPGCRAARKRFYREMLDYHRRAQKIVATWAALRPRPSRVFPIKVPLGPALRARSVGPSHVQENENG